MGWGAEGGVSRVGHIIVVPLCHTNTWTHLRLCVCEESFGARGRHNESIAETSLNKHLPNVLMFGR